MSISEQSTSAGVPHVMPLRGQVEAWRIDWFNLYGVIVYHALTVLAFTPWFFSWYGLAFALVGHYTIGLLGVNLCYHRLLTHRSFECPRWLEYPLAIIGVFCGQDTPAYWVAAHRRHHQFADDQELDPHTPVRSFLWAHVGWVLYKSDTMQRAALTRRYAPDLLRQPFYAWLEQHWVMVMQIGITVIFAAGFAVGWLSGMATADAAMLGFEFVLWGIVVRIVVTWHCTWLVASVSHKWGYRNYDTREESRNNWVVALLNHGEWHNNHHAHPASAMARTSPVGGRSGMVGDPAVCGARPREEHRHAPPRPPLT